MQRYLQGMRCMFGRTGHDKGLAMLNEEKIPYKNTYSHVKFISKVFGFPLCCSCIQVCTVYTIPREAQGINLKVLASSGTAQTRDRRNYYCFFYQKPYWYKGLQGIIVLVSNRYILSLVQTMTRPIFSRLIQDRNFALDNLQSPETKDLENLLYKSRTQTDTHVSLLYWSHWYTVCLWCRLHLCCSSLYF